MKKLLIPFILGIFALTATAQQKNYWVFLTDKDNTSFDPYSYFDAKAIARYQQCGADLYDISNYPLNEQYVNAIDGYSDEVFGHSRWLNALGITTTDDRAALIAQFPFVKEIKEISSDFIITEFHYNEIFDNETVNSSDKTLSEQIQRFGGEHFVNNGIDGKGLRICVLDAGFPKVDTHPVFKHLRDNHQILMTYNFPSKCENVYGWGTHGTMVLSCIAGMDGDKMLGLATGAEFLLGRTEIDPEPFKEEVWWAQGAEWADKNGADIINSSLGYGKDRHWTKDMDGTSYVAKAANMAVEKGILVCNSAGNDGDDKRWMTIITPSDAENVLCVGGILSELDFYHRIGFSSLGPTADKRLKPNVVAFGQAVVANPSNNKTTQAYGTSFSSPLTAGFCACAWQTRRDLTALQMKAEIEKSADLYPYFDYAYGYGVPQAAYFTNELPEKKRSFQFVEDKDEIKIHFLGEHQTSEVFANVEGPDGVLLGYYQLVNKENKDIVIKKNTLGQGRKLNVCYAGYTDSLPLNGTGTILQPFSENAPEVASAQNSTFPKIKQEAWSKNTYFQYDYNLGNTVWNGFNRHFAFGRRWMYGKTYKVGFGLGLDFNRFVCNDKDGVGFLPYEKTVMRSMQVRGELFQRIVIRLWGINWDLGAYGGINVTRRVKGVYNETWYDFGNVDPTQAQALLPLDPQPYNNKVVTMFKGAKAMNLFEYGAATRLSYSIANTVNIGVYARYRLSDILVKDDVYLGNKTDQPSPWSFGLEIEF